MYYVLLDSTGNLIASYRDEDEARAALAQLVEDDPEAEDDVALMTYDDQGEIAADPVFGVSTVAAVGAQHEIREWYGSLRRVDVDRGEETRTERDDLVTT